MPSARDVLDLEELMAGTWPPLEQEWLGRWLLRAGGGWTGRANSALPLGDPDGDDTSVLSAVEEWYEMRGLPPRVAVPLPTREDLDGVLADKGWQVTHGGLVMTARSGAVLQSLPDRADLPDPTFADEPDEAWLSAYHYRGGPLPAHAVEILRGGGARFASIRDGAEVYAVGRFALVDDTVGITAMEVAEERRGAGVGSYLLRTMVRAAASQGADLAWLQVDPENEAGRALYTRAAFQVHHRYHYRTRAERTQP